VDELRVEERAGRLEKLIDLTRRDAAVAEDIANSGEALLVEQDELVVDPEDAAFGVAVQLVPPRVELVGISFDAEIWRHAERAVGLLLDDEADRLGYHRGEGVQVTEVEGERLVAGPFGPRGRERVRCLERGDQLDI